ncbi:MAG: lysine--tRNA ligase, partial [Ilumatobacteraceae bacterium]
MSTEIPSQTGASEVVGNGASSELDSTNLATFRERRLAEIDSLRTNGVNPYPYRFDRTHTLGE